MTVAAKAETSRLEYGKLRFQSAKPTWKWTSFVAGLWSWHSLAAIRALTQRMRAWRRAGRDGGMQPNRTVERRPAAGAEPAYVSLAAKYLQSALKDVRAYDGFEISALALGQHDEGLELACLRALP